MPNPTSGVRAYHDSLPERSLCLRDSEIPSRVSFLRACVQDDLVTSASLQRLVESESLVSLEAAIQDAICNFGQAFSIRKRSFTKTARTRLNLIGNRDPGVPDDLVCMLVKDAIRCELMEPNHVESLLCTGNRAGGLLAGSFLDTVSAQLPQGIGLTLDDGAMLLHADQAAAFKLNLPEDDSAASHALRMGVMHALQAMSTGIAFFNHPQLMYDPSYGICYNLQEIWDMLKTSVAGLSIDEIKQLILEIDPADFDYELYWLGIDDLSELEPKSAELNTLATLLFELDSFSRLYSINPKPYYDDIQAACNQQIEFLRGQSERYPEHSGVYHVLIDVMGSVIAHHQAGKTYAAIIKTRFVEEASENLEDVMALMQCTFVMPSNSFVNIGDIVDESINADINGAGFPAVAFAYSEGVVTQALHPMMEVIAEVHTLLTNIMNALGEVDYVGEKY